jgi:hypothetical protein
MILDDLNEDNSYLFRYYNMNFQKRAVVGEFTYAEPYGERRREPTTWRLAHA